MSGVGWIRSASPRRAPRAGATWVALVLLAGLTSACGTGPVEPLRPLGDASAPRATTPGAATDPTGTPPASITPSAPEPAGPTTTAPEPGDGPGRIVADVLDRYDRVLARLHADPAAMNRPGDPVGSELLGELGRVVPAGAVLFDDIRSQLAGRAARGESIPVEDRQLPYVHHGIDADAEGADRVTFTWCSWSPGVVRDTATGAVVDDTVGQGTGTGVAERIDGTWMLASLDESTLDLLPAGTADPCPGADRSRP